MRIKEGEYIREVKCVQIRKTDIIVNCIFYQTERDTEKIGNQLLTQGYADLSDYRKIGY